MKKILILLLTILSKNTTNYECLKETLKSGYSILKLFSDFSRIGPFFDKSQLLTNYNNFQNLIKNCKGGEIPTFLDIDECIDFFIKVTIEINLILIDVDRKKFDVAVLNTVLLYGKLIQLNNICLNSKLFQKLNLNIDLESLKIF